MKRTLMVAGGLLTAALVASVGLRVQPPPFRAGSLVGARPGTVALEAGLPAPVQRFYRELYGEEVPVVETAVISGRGTMRVQGITLPVRFRFTHEAGQDYRHHIQATMYGVPFLTVNETYLDGTARLELPFGVSQGPNIDQGANLALWAEAIWMPSVWLTDRRVDWAAIDDSSAALTVPFGDRKERFTATFDPDTGLLRQLRSMRFKAAGDEHKTPWLNEVVTWDDLGGVVTAVRTQVTWLDEGSPWADLRTEEIVYNADVRDQLRGSGR